MLLRILPIFTLNGLLKTTPSRGSSSSEPTRLGLLSLLLLLHLLRLLVVHLNLSNLLLLSLFRTTSRTNQKAVAVCLKATDSMSLRLNWNKLHKLSVLHTSPRLKLAKVCSDGLINVCRPLVSPCRISLLILATESFCSVYWSLLLIKPSKHGTRRQTT